MGITDGREDGVGTGRNSRRAANPIRQDEPITRARPQRLQWDDFDETVAALAQTAKEMNGKYKETSEAGLAQNLTLC